MATSVGIDWGVMSIPGLKVSLDDRDCEVIALLATRGTFRTLKELCLTGNRISDLGATTLAKASWALPKLQILMLGENMIGDKGVVALADAFGRGSLPELSEIQLHSSDTCITEAALAALIDAAQQWRTTTISTDIGRNQARSPVCVSTLSYSPVYPPGK